tara:strand:- start:888 stop:1451 length:564 start_codon:yes stop_codon:yes gene_type:complete
MDDQKKKIIFLDDSLKNGEYDTAGGEVVRDNAGGEVVSDNAGGEVVSDNAERAVDDDTSEGVVEDDTSGEQFTDNEQFNSKNKDEDEDEDTQSVASYDSGLISEGGRSSGSSEGSSVNTQDLLSVDPMYIRLTKFLETDVGIEGGGKKRVNVTEILSDISTSLKEIKVTFKEMSDVFQKMAVTNASQ